MPVYKRVNKNFFKTWNSKMAYILGFFAADGYITVNKRGGQFWCIQITDKKLLEDIKGTIESEHAINIRIRKNKMQQIQYRLQIGSIEMCNDLRKLGFAERKTKSLVIPHIPKNYFSDFIRGYFDGDGNVWVGDIHKDRAKKTKAIITAFTSCSHVFLTELYKNLSNIGIEGGSIYRIKDTYSRLQFATNNSLKLYKIMYNKESFGSLYLKRKKDRFDAFVKMRT
jgi:intein-encoded DNA endonuclease-like protein